MTALSARAILIPERSDGPSGREIARDAGRSVLTALIEARARYGPDQIAVEDGDKRVLTYNDLVRAVAALSRVIRRECEGERVALLLPSAAGAVVAFFAVLAAGKTPAMLNFTAGRSPILAACKLAAARCVLTSERFLSLAKLEPIAQALGEVASVIAMEALRERVTWRDKAFAAAAAPLRLLPRQDADAPAVIVFTSGAEGDPKGVALSHRNMLANVAQVDAAVPLAGLDSFFNPLPLFHSYGLTPGMILPLVLGRRLVLHPSPLRAKEVAARIAETRPKVLLATDTFLRQYARAGDPGSMSSLVYAVCGAERVRHETRELVRSRFGFTVIEGYGVTEASPVLAANHPDDIRDGTVGKFFHGVEAKLEPVPGLTGGARLLVRGPNVMAGYLAANGTLRTPPDGWHDTGDVVAYEDGYVAIVGRLKRFAKIGGEMTSLVTVEQVAGRVWPNALHAAAVAPAGRRGEAIILLTEEPDADPSALLARLKADGLSERFMPHKVFQVDAIPVLGSGKVDNVAVTRLAKEKLALAE